MGSFFDDIGRKADTRRAMSKEQTERLIEQGIIASKERRDQGIANVAAIPAGLFTGATGFFGDLEALGKGLYRSGATRNAIGQAQEGHVGALEEIANIYDANDTLMPNSEGQRDYIKDKLKDTWYGDQVEQGDIGLLLGEILAPVPTVAGLGKATKLVGNAVADTVGTGIKAERGMGLSKGIDQLLGMTQDPAMVIGPKSRNWSKASEDAFNKALPNKEAIINNRKATGTFSPVDAEAKVWEETAELGNPTFLDIDGVVKQEIPTGDFSVTTRYNNKNKPMKMVSDLNNPSLNTYDQLSNGINAKRGRPSNVHGVGYMNIPADKAVLNNNSLGTYNPNNNIMSVNPNKSKAIQKNTMAHEGQHAIQDIEKDFATGSWPELYKAKNLDDIYYSSDKAKSNAVKQLRANDMDNYTSDIQSTHLSLHDDPSGMGAYLRDPGEMLARATGDRVNLDKAGIKKNHILDTYEDMMWDNNGIMPNDVLDAKLNELLKANGGIPESNKFPKILDKALANPGNKEYRKYFKGLDIKEGSFKRELQPSGHSHLTFEMNDGRVGKLTNVPNTPDNDHNSLQNTLKYIRNGINRAGQDIDAGNGRAGGSFEWIQPQKKNNNVSYSMEVNPKQAYRPGYVYKTVNTVDGKKYIGSRLSPQGTQGEYFDEKYYGSGADLKKAIAEHGKDKFINVKQQDTNSIADIIESETGLLRKLKVKEDPNYYNKHNHYSGGGDATEVTKKKISDMLKGKNKGRKLGPQSEEHKIKIGKASKGRKHSKETKIKISKLRAGRPSPNKGKKMSEEQKRKISKSRTGQKMSEEHRRKVSEGHKGQKAWNKGMTREDEAIYKTLNKEERIQFRKDKGLL